MKLTKWMAAAALFLSFGVAGCTDDITDEVSQLTRNTDEVSVAYNKDATARISVRVPGAWSASVACKDAAGQETAAWLRLDPAEGVGNGKDYQWITAIADRNLGGEREAVITIVGATRGDAVEVKVTQDDGTFTVKKPVLSGDLKANVVSNALLAVEYDKAKGGEPVEITFTFDGDDRGLAIKDYTGTIEGEGSGKIELPITGTPSDIGVVKLNMKMTIEGKTIFDDVISLNIQSENFIFSMDFGKFVWGGDLMANKKGKCPGGKQVSGQDITGLEEADGEVSVGTDGAGDAFKSLGETYRINRDLVGWQGERVYEHPGYIKLGTGSNNGWIQTPKMDKLSSAPQTVVVSFDISLYDKSDDLILFTAEGAGSVEGGGNISLPTFSGWANAKWTTCTFVVNGATSATSFKWASTKTDGKGRFVLDNISVMSSAVKERTEPLEKVDAERILYTSGANSIEVEWPGVADATGYEVALVPQENPSFVNKAVVPAAEGVDDVFSHEFTDLQPGFYIFEIVALYEPNPEFDSEKVSVLLGTEGFLAGPLKTPEATASATSYAVTISWETVSGASGYKAVLKEAGAVVKEQSVDADALSCTFGELTPDRDYAVAVQALYESKPEYNSEFTADIAVHTPALLTRPVVHLYDGFEVTHNMAIVEWDIDAAQQSDTKTSLQLLEGSKLIYNFSKWGLPSAKYKFPRFVFGGLKANTTYTARIQRISADASKFGDSEWGEYIFTTTAKADHSDCLFYADFNEHWWGGNGAAIAFGMYPKTEKDDLTGDLTQLAYTSGTPVKNMPNPNSGCGAVPADYHRLFLSQWDASKLPTATEDYMLRSYLTAGILKFGSTENNGYMPIPYMTSLTGPTTVVLTFKSSPYCEPNTSTGDLEVGNAVLDGREGVWVRLKEADGAKIVKADGVAVAAENATDVLVKHKLPAEYGANSKKCFEFTDHEVVIEGVTAKTLIQIYTKLYKATAEYDKYNTPGDRAWIDDVIVRKQ